MLCVHTYSILHGPIVIFVIAADVAAHTCPWYDIIESMVPHTKLHCILHKKKKMGFVPRKASTSSRDVECHFLLRDYSEYLLLFACCSAYRFVSWTIRVITLAVEYEIISPWIISGIYLMALFSFILWDPILL